MLIDHAWLESAALPPVVIVGSGPAGISLALALEGHGIDSLILEAGEELYDPDIQDAYVGEVVGDEYFYLDSARLRMLGGTSGHWNGWCRALDPIDFEERPGIAHTGWPIGVDDLSPYLAAANEILDTEVRLDPPEESLSEIAFFRSNPIVRFGEKYLAHIEQSDRVHLCLRAPLLSLEGDGTRTTALSVGRPDGASIALSPDRIVLACGGIENSRLLLWSNAVSEGPVVPQDAALGRYWMEHPHHDVAEANVSDILLERASRTPLGVLHFAPSAEAMRQYGILNGGIRLSPRLGGDSGAMMKTARSAACLVEPVGRWTWRQMGRHLWCRESVRMSWEQAPDVDNRIELSSDDRDAWGIPRTVLHWRKTALDYRTPKIILELFGRKLLDEGLGQLKLMHYMIDEADYPTGGEIAGYHHMGGTRMSIDPATGVVDASLRIHGNQNTYVAGSSVFPTGGHANPTFSIVQLSLRLGDHLAATI